MIYMAPTVLVEYTGPKESKKYAQKVVNPVMGKTRKFAKGYSSGYIRDCGHSIETMGETEGFGSSGPSEDSCAPKRKCISLNADKSDSFGVTAQVLSLSKISRSERKDLEVRLKEELEQVQNLQKKIALWSTNGVVDIRSCSDGKKKPPLENFPESSELFSGPTKKKLPRNGSRMKRGVSGKVESAKQTAPINTTNAMLMKQCETLLKRLMSHQFGWAFNTPVDVVKLNIPDYFTVIKHPMDLGTVKSKIASGAYSSPLEYLSDVRLTFTNAMTYNPPGNDFHLMADSLSKYFEVRWKSIEKKLSVTDTQILPAKSSAHEELKGDKAILPSNKRKNPSPDCIPEPVASKMTVEEKLNLSRELEALLAEMPDHIVDFLKGHSFDANQNGEEEIEIDIDALSDETLFTLRKLLDDYLQERQTKQARVEPSEVELLNESGLSNLSMQPCQGNANADEDVDIGGNDAPVSSYPPVEIEKDTAHRNNKCSSSSSSSSESGSSSSDSDSGSSSGSESVGAKASTPVNTNKVLETLVPGTEFDQKRSDIKYLQDGNQSVSGLDQQEQNLPPNTVSVEVDSRQEGESAPSQRQVSPEKLYRAAQLRSRFADTILRAREKTFDKGEKGDPEKLRREREELERKQREEKARLQAEAKAAEEARRQAEARAAAEAKRKRELEREAARQALQKMEKTVEINENCQFLEDLEMLRAVPVDHLPSSVDETSPDLSQDAMGSFKLQGSSNPLEQLGLYMKMDEDEEDECEPQNVGDMVDDIEEGEID